MEKGNEFVPFGDEWEKEMNKVDKKGLIEMLKTQLQVNNNDLLGDVSNNEIKFKCDCIRHPLAEGVILKGCDDCAKRGYW